MDIFEEARSLSVMMKMRGLSQNGLAKMLGVSQPYVANKLRLLQLDKNVQDKIIAANLSERHARALLRLEEEKRHIALYKIIERSMTVAESEALVDTMRISSSPKLVGAADRLSHIDKFIDCTGESLKTLSSLGIKASQKINYFDNKILITIYIENGK